MAQATQSSLAVKDASAVTQTRSEMTDPNNSSYLVPKVFPDESVNIKATYRYSSTGNTLAATPTDVLTLVGSATTTVRVKRIAVSGLCTGGDSTQNIQLIKRTAANTAGTATSGTVCKHDSSDAAATAVPTLYTANPSSLGAGVQCGCLALNLGAAGSAGTVEWNFANRMDKAIVLRGVAQCLAINLGGTALAAGTVLNYEMEWEEDAS
jgi:hypothetical protein